MKERLQKIISARGITSRRKAEQMIAEGRVFCNGRVCVLGESADPEKDEITIDGRMLPQLRKPTYLMLHKPRGYVTTMSDEKGRPTAYSLVEECGKRVYPVGRLDMDSEGLLLFTDDGEFANKLMHPSHEIRKTYLVYVNGCTPQSLEELEKPVVLDGYRIKKPEIQLWERSARGGKAAIRVTIHEGRNRQVRRMCQMAGMEVLRLIRIQEGELELGDLPCGKWRYLEAWEIEALQK